MKSTLLALLLFAASPQVQIDWVDSLEQSGALLRSGQSMRAYVIIDRVIDDMVQRYGGEEPSLFVTALAQKAVALAGLGREEEARWYWDYALFLAPNVGDAADIAGLGRGIEILKRPRPPIAPDARRVGGSITSPKLIYRVEPRYPEGARLRRVSGIVIVECVIDANGVVREGRVLKNLPVPTFGYTALEAVRQWQFEPATQNGKPVPVVFNVTINFKLVASDD